MLAPMPIDAPAKTDRLPMPRSATAGYVLAGVVLAASLLLVYLYWRSAHEREMAAAQAAFTALAHDTTGRLVRRLGNHELIARGGVSLSASVARPSRRQWQNYVEGLDLRAIEPGPWELLCLPLRIRDGDGAPARVVLRGPLPLP